MAYSGKDNPLVFQDEATLTFKCYFELKMYPFDRQKCFVVFKLKDMTEELGVLVQASPAVASGVQGDLLESTEGEHLRDSTVSRGHAGIREFWYRRVWVG